LITLHLRSPVHFVPPLYQKAKRSELFAALPLYKLQSFVCYRKEGDRDGKEDGDGEGNTVEKGWEMERGGDRDDEGMEKEDRQRNVLQKNER